MAVGGESVGVRGHAHRVGPQAGQRGGDRPRNLPDVRGGDAAGQRFRRADLPPRHVQVDLDAGAVHGGEAGVGGLPDADRDRAPAGVEQALVAAREPGRGDRLGHDRLVREQGARPRAGGHDGVGEASLSFRGDDGDARLVLAYLRDGGVAGDAGTGLFGRRGGRSGVPAPPTGRGPGAAVARTRTPPCRRCGRSVTRRPPRRGRGRARRRRIRRRGCRARTAATGPWSPRRRLRRRRQRSWIRSFSGMAGLGVGAWLGTVAPGAWRGTPRARRTEMGRSAGEKGIQLWWSEEPLRSVST